MRVKIPAGQGVYLLSEHTYCRIAHIVMQILQAGIYHFFALVVNHLKIVSVHMKDFGQYLHMRRKYIWGYYSIVFFHFFGEIHCHFNLRSVADKAA